MQIFVGFLGLLSCALAGKPAEWACTAVNRVAYKDLSCVTSADYNAGHGAFFITTKKVSTLPSTHMCVVEVDGAGMKETKDFYLKTTIRAASNMAFAGISYNMRDHTEGNYIYFRLGMQSTRNNFVEGYVDNRNIQVSRNYDYPPAKDKVINIELLSSGDVAKLFLDGNEYRGRKTETYYRSPGKIAIALPNYIGSNVMVSNMEICSPVSCIAPDGSIIKGGESYTDSDGKKCTCRSTGQMECVCDVPVSPCPAGTTRWTDPDTCESKCIRGPQYCRSSGDPHYRTFDNKYYDFHGTCTYQAASCGEFEVFFKNYDLYGRAPRFTGRIELQFNNEVFAIKNGFLATVNDQNVQIPYVKTYTNGDRVEIINSGQLEIRLYNKGRNPSVRLRANNAGRYINAEMWLHGSCADITQGLCGNFNGNPNDDLIGNNPNTHGETYKEYDESCPAPPKPYHPCDDVPNGHAQAEAVCSDFKNPPFAQCANLVDIGTKDGGILKDCMTDVCFCWLDESCACDSYDSYATECLAKNPPNKDSLVNWRKAIEYCPYKCPAGQTYQPDGKVPAPTCLNKNPDQTGTERGCFCSPGKLLQDGQCISPNQCKCLHEGKFYQNGEKIVKEGECEVCICRDGGEMTCEDMQCPTLNCDDDEIVSYKPDKCCGFCNDNWVIAVNPDNKLKKGQGVVLTCDIQAEGIFKKDITWYKDGRKTTAGLSKDRRRLTIKDAGKDDGAKYTCQANKDGKVGSADFNVEVIMPAECKYEDGRTWEEGKIFKPTDTIECTCNAQGQHECECVDDGKACPDDKPLVWLDDDCVKTCVPEYGLCSASADPHYRTFDGTEYDFKGDCKYTFFTCNDIAIYADHEKDKASTHTRSLDFVYKQDTYNFVGDRVTLNGQAIILPMHKVYESVTLSISNVGNYIVTVNGNGLDPLVEMKWDRQSSYSVKAHGICKGSSKGLCGKWNGKSSDDFTTSDGKKAANPEDFGTSWALDDEADCPTPPEPEDMCKIMGVDRAPFDKYVKDVLSAGVFKQCGAKIDSTTTAENAVQEICTCVDDKSCACVIFEQYAEQCATAGFDTSDWKKNNKASVCTPDCDPGTVWNPRGPKPAPTCAKPEGGKKRQPACFCPEGKVLQDNKCIDVKDCNCEYEGKLYKAGQKYKVEAECKECTCIRAGKVECGAFTCKTNCGNNEIEVEVEGKCCPVCRADWVEAVNPDAQGKMKAPLVLTCKVDGVTVKKSDVKWYKFNPGNTDITNSKKTYTVSDDGLQLTIKSMDDKKVGNYKCVVEKDGKTSEGEFKVSLPIQQEDLISAVNDEVDFVEGTDVLLEVQKLPGKTITEIYWMCNGERITAKTDGYKITNKASSNRLTIQNAQEKHKGSCTCFAKGMGTEDSEEIKITGKAGSVTLTPLESKVECIQNKKGCRVGCKYETNGPKITQANTKICKLENNKDTGCKSAKCNGGSQECSITFGSKTPLTAAGTYTCIASVNGNDIRSSKIDVIVKPKRKL